MSENPEFGKQQKEEIGKWFRRFVVEPQDRKPNGKLANPLTELFEKRMNEALDELHDLMKFRDEQNLNQMIGDVALEGEQQAAWNI